MKDPDIKLMIGSVELRYVCIPIIGLLGKYRIISFRKTSVLSKDVSEDEARAFCKRHKIDFT